MRCIEIVEGTIGEDCVLMININMRCIEIELITDYLLTSVRLTLT